jgi:NADPH2:quinone reductase
MQLIQFRAPGPPGVLQCLEAPIPAPKAGEVLIRAHAIGVGIPDTLIRAGTYGHMPPLPATPGTELSGVIEKVGAGVTSRQAGQRVYLDAAAALANYQVAYHIFNDALRLRAGENVLVHAAAGGMGNALIDLAKAAGLTVIGVAGGEGKARFARDLGADHVIDRKNEDVAARVAEISGGRGVDAIIDPVAGPTIPGNLALLAPCGVLVIYGGLGGKAPLDLEQTLRAKGRSPAIRHFTIHTWDDLVEERRAGMRAVIAMLAAGKLHPRIHAVLPLAQAARAHELLESGAVLGKLLLRP